MILLFDTETTGLPDWRKPAADASQPAITQLAMILCTDEGREVASASMLVQPMGKQIQAEAAAITGITQDLAETCGTYPGAALYLWDRWMQMAHTIVAHNVKFDRLIIEASWATHSPLRNSKVPKLCDRLLVDGERKWFCTMDAASPLVNLPPTARMVAAGFNKPKPPKLSEAIKFFFDEDLEGAHDALVDVRACARIFFHLRALEAAKLLETAA